MSAFSLLEQMLKSGLPAAGTPQRDDLNKYAKGAAVGGVLGLLLGTRRGRGIGGTALKFGSVAALGALAWKAYQEHQARQPGAPSAAAGAPAATPASFAALPALQQEVHGRAMLKALIAAAKADGHMDEREQGLVHAELQRTGADAATRTWVEAELRRPVEPTEVAAAATGPEMAAEMYLASLLVVDQTSTMERAYLDALATELRLAPSLKTDLEARANAA
ncbi:MAG: tellurite resistance TerB family protein [Rubrivivax sp.]|nr:tellurite resistance TerB family protein [Rubrivivax sp.]